ISRKAEVPAHSVTQRVGGSCPRPLPSDNGSEPFAVLHCGLTHPEPMRATFYVLTRPQKVFVVCAAVFLTALVIAEATAGKFFTAFTLPFSFRLLGVTFDSVVMTAGVLAFPVTFIVTDVMNEYFGKRGIRFVTLLGMAMVVFEFALLQAALAVPTAPISPVPDAPSPAFSA